MTSVPPTQHTFEKARQLEIDTGRPHYIVRTFPDGAGEGASYTITDRMPLVSRGWFTTDELQHA